MRVGILKADNASPEFIARHGDYQARFEKLFKLGGASFEYRVYACKDGVFPSSVSESDAWVITGSKHSVFEDLPWLRRFEGFVKDLKQAGKKTVGVCFGHQLIAHALGGKVVRFEGGYGVGVRMFRPALHLGWMRPELETVSLLYSHQDQVEELPPGATFIGGNDFCRNMMFCAGTHMLGLQGHPESTREGVRDIMEKRRERMGEACYKAGLESLAEPTDEAVVAKWIVDFLTV